MSFGSPDIDILHWINVDRIAGLDGVFEFLSNTAPYISGLIPLSFIVIGLLKRRSEIRMIGYKIAAPYLLSVIISNVLKHLIDRPRPFTIYPFIQKLSSGGSGSFPSGHTSDVFAIATAVSLLFPKKAIVIPIYLWAGLVAYSRMDLGVHYPSDVLGGIVIGAGSALICRRLFNRKSTEHPA